MLHARDSHQLADDGMEGAVLVIRRAMVLQPRMGFGLEPLQQRSREARLADARLAGDEHDAPFAGLGLLPAPRQQIELLVSPEQRRGEIGPTSLKTVLHPACPGDVPHVHRVGEAFERLPAEVAVVEQGADQPMRLGADQQCVGLGQRLQAGGEVGRFADRRLLLRDPFAHEVAHHDYAGGDADPCLQGDARRSLQVARCQQGSTAPRVPRVRRRLRAPQDSRNRPARRRPDTVRPCRPSV